MFGACAEEPSTEFHYLLKVLDSLRPTVKSSLRKKALFLFHNEGIFSLILYPSRERGMCLSRCLSAWNGIAGMDGVKREGHLVAIFTILRCVCVQTGMLDRCVW